MRHDDWQPTCSARALKARAQLYAATRQFFAERQVMEVSTPVLAAHGVTDPHIPSIAVPAHGYLQSSPEYHMKRLLAAGSGPIYQISQVFRDGESGQRHNPEFTLLEWYRPGFDLQALIDETVALLSQQLSQQLAQQLARPPVQQHRFRDLFATVTGLDPLRAPLADLYQASPDQLPADLDRAALVDYLMATRVEAALPANTLTIVSHYPGWAAALSRTAPDTDGETVAERFEIYFGAMELANGYHELTDASEQAQRFQSDQLRRQDAGLPAMAADPRLLAALTAGLPDCAGVAVGLDRLLMCQLGAPRIRDVLAFPGDIA
ncbi:EF-P lysine aminoacylase GenX [Alcanivorax sp. JB21]|uniref:EF-P lysine aminoacylase EpmA n=1 Tax=Alcanivorax limicola TaxID=2874102 RepID=UPI001CC02C8D|nr:EF-P lysine aminoacylase EpmA [Alcanivorax limicola]MBZ2190270.1 EF-P lysine aminoacylase GenX [Alcanivorax limicola]